MGRYNRQLGGLVRRGCLGKLDSWKGSILELVLPIGFASLVLLLKGLADVYDSPNIAYSCGPAVPFDNVVPDPLGGELGWIGCFVAPDPGVCTEAEGYYQNVVDIPLLGSLATSLGYINFLAFPVANSAPYPAVVSSVAEAPSLPLLEVLTRMAGIRADGSTPPRAIFALAPEDASLAPQVTRIKAWIDEQVAPASDGGCAAGADAQLLCDTTVIFDSEAALEAYIGQVTYDDEDPLVPKIGFAVVIQQTPAYVDVTETYAEGAWRYAIRSNFTSPIFGQQAQPTVACLYDGRGRECGFKGTIPATNIPPVDNFQTVQSTTNIYGYAYSGFLTVQNTIDRYILSYGGDEAMIDPLAAGAALTASVGMMPTRAFQTNNFFELAGNLLGLFFMLSFIFPVSRFIRAVVLDKERRVKETIKIMGVQPSVIDVAWFVMMGTQMLIASIGMAIVIDIGVFTASNGVLVWIWIAAFCMSIVTFCFLLSAFFSKSKAAATVGPLIFFACFFPSAAVQDPSVPGVYKTAACLLAPTCMALGSNVITSWEAAQTGVQWSNITTNTGNISFFTCVFMLCLDFVLYGIIAVYLDKVVPSEFGTRRPWYYPCQSLYKCVSGQGEETSAGAGLSEGLLSGTRSDGHDLTVDDVDSKQPAGAKIEAVGSDLTRQIEQGRCVSCQGLRRVFSADATGGEPKVAVDSLHLNMYEGQITVLLGHNGAGKTTTISMLTGLIPPTSGEAYIQGRPISTEMAEIRQSLGLCPQHDVLFPELNVAQHLEVFAAFKNVPAATVPTVVDDMIARVGLKEKTFVKSHMLSGGQKRKLSVGISLLGDSSTVILDEPSSGMDPFSRRSMWTLLQNSKAGRVMMLTTHFMDEADILGDRIAIMGDGKLRCCGSSLFLKKEYGVGYNVTVLLDDSAAAQRPVCAMFEKMVPESEQISCVGAEISYRLPFSASSSFPALFNGFEAQKQQLSIAEYGVSVTTLEEVFLLVASGEREIGKETDLGSSALQGDATRDPESNSLTVQDKQGMDGIDANGSGVFTGQLYALFKKRYNYARRDKKNLICQVVVPGLLVLQALLLLTFLNFANIDGGDELVLTPVAQFNDGQTNPNVVAWLNPTANADVDSIRDSAGGFLSTTIVDVDIPLVSPDAFAGCSQAGTTVDNPPLLPSETPPLTAMSDFLLRDDAYDADSDSIRYGAVTFAALTAADTRLYQYNVLVNATAVHGPPTYINMVNDAILKSLWSTTGTGTSSITVSNKPLPLTVRQINTSASGDAFSAATYIVIAFAFLPASYAIFVVRERETGAKHQQLISGVSLPAYWIATYAWDVISYLIPSGFSLMLFFIFGIEAYTQNQGAVATVLLFLLYGPAVAAQTYCVSYLFKSHSTAQNVVLIANFIFGLGLMITSFVLDAIESTRDVNAILKHFFRLLPGFCLGNGLTQLSFCIEGRDCPISFFSTEIVSPLDWQSAGTNILYLGCESVIYFLIALGIEYALSFPKIASFFQYTRDPGHVPEVLDEDVQVEADRVKSGAATNECVQLIGLRKVYSTPVGPKIAIQDLSFGIPQGECFGFLGINGAGKTTTLSILSGDVAPTRGKAYISGLDIETEQLEVRRLIGYCPQHDALLDLLTVEEHLELYARIKGVPPHLMVSVVHTKMQQLDLLDFSDKMACTLSGGNKRKLSVAISMIGSPSVVFLDEPSTGMDPVARRYMWDVISGLSTRGGQCSVILTTHSMEEAEALCTRIGIMVNGQLRCIGSGQHLKTRFGKGFEIDVGIELPAQAEITDFASQLARLGDSSGNLAVKLDSPELLGALRTTGRQGAEQWAAELSRGGASVEASALFESEAVGFVPLATLVEWCLCELAANNLREWFRATFEEAEELERSSSNSFRYRVRKSANLTLGDVFGSFEQASGGLKIREYSVGQTTLEQIFNQFASTQLNPENS